jgi:hypothetical protein
MDTPLESIVVIFVQTTLLLHSKKLIYNHPLTKKENKLGFYLLALWLFNLSNMGYENYAEK